MKSPWLAGKFSVACTWLSLASVGERTRNGPGWRGPREGPGAGGPRGHRRVANRRHRQRRAAATPELEVGESTGSTSRRSRSGSVPRQAQLTVGQDLWLDVPLAVAIRQDVDVAAPFVTIDRDSAGLGTLIDQRQVLGLPLDGAERARARAADAGTSPSPRGSASSVRGDFASAPTAGARTPTRFSWTACPTWTRSSRRPASARRSMQSTSSASRRPPTMRRTGRNAAGQVNVITRAGIEPVHRLSQLLRDGALGSRKYLRAA